MALSVSFGETQVSVSKRHASNQYKSFTFAMAIMFILVIITCFVIQFTHTLITRLEI